MKSSFLKEALKSSKSEEFIRSASDASLLRTIASDLDRDIIQKNPERLPRLAFLFETQGMNLYRQLTPGRIAEKDSAQIELKREMLTAFTNAFHCWRALLNLDKEDNKPSKVGLEIVNKEFESELPNLQLDLAFHLAVTGILSERTAEVRLELKKFDFSKEQRDLNWRDKVLSDVFQAFVLISRKGNGWEDIDNALQRIAALRDIQSEREEDYLNRDEEQHAQIKAAIDLVGIYHLAQMISIAAEYLQTGSNSASKTTIDLDRHCDEAKKAFESSKSDIMFHLSDLLWAGCRQNVQNAIWTHIATLPPRVKDFARLLTERGRPNPIIELWPAQQEALARNLLTTYHRAVLVEMPTSAGKTLLAKFVIVQTKALTPEGTIAYVVPTRALVNQITFDLRTDFSGLKNPNIRVEQTIPAFELDPTEDVLLQKPPDVLVVTPEKLDLLVRRNHIVTENISLVIADEVHNIKEKERGVRLELLLGTIKRDRPHARFLLLSPWLPNDNELLAWLGEGLELPPISVTWKPGNRIVGLIDVKGRQRNRRVIFETLPAIDNSDIQYQIAVPIGGRSAVPASKAIRELSKACTKVLSNRGAVLILCRGQTTATNRANEIANDLDKTIDNEDLKSVLHYLETEAGTSTVLIDCLRKGVAYHHAGLSHESRWLIEVLIKKNLVKVICGTTTLAQGINFPISTVIVETLQKGEEKLSYHDFWNIAGRAGRALMDTVGVVTFPAPTPDKKREFATFLKGEAEEISSQLAELITRADEIAQKFDIKAVLNNPGLSALLQFLSHAMKVAGRTDLANEVEDIMRASLVYHQVKKKDTTAAEKLLNICKAYLRSLGRFSDRQRILGMADRTGFATPSVLRILAQTSTDVIIKDVKSWYPSNIFGHDIQNLTRKIEIIGELPEIRLGAGAQPPFNASRVAEILRDWVNGESLDNLSQKYSIEKIEDKDKRISKFSSYLFSQLIGRASWGLGALESICLEKASEKDKKEVEYIPSMVFYGVNRKEAIWMRMIGAPRVLANGLAELWVTNNMLEPDSYDRLRSWTDSLSENDWQSIIPRNSPLTAKDCKRLWTLLSR